MQMLQKYHEALYPTARRVFAKWLPPPDLTLSQWAEANVFLSSENSAEPGKWHAYSYQVGIMDALTDAANEYVTFQKSARVGYTKIINWDIAYNIHQSPCPMLVVQPTIEDAQGYSKDEIAPMLRDIPALCNLVADAKTRDSNNTILKKNFLGGTLNLVGANSARGFRRLTVRKVYFDEVDAYPPTAGSEGDQIKLGIRRTETFWNRQIVIGGTPTIKGFSRVESHFQRSDQRYFYVPCPQCNFYQTITWAKIRWPKGDPDQAHMVCGNCRAPISHRHKKAMLDKGRWQATQPFSGHAGFAIWAGYSLSPNSSWDKLAKEFLECHKDPAALQVFVNTILGETWEEQSEGIELDTLTARTESISGLKIPDGVLAITAGIDVQHDRIEVELCGWGRGEESWSIEYIVIAGDPETETPWARVEEILSGRYHRQDGILLTIAAACIDSGYATQSVYRFCWQRAKRRIVPVKGMSSPGRPLVGNPRKIKLFPGLFLYPVGSDTAKNRVYARLSIKTAGPGFCHFPDHYPEEYFKQLTAEKIFKKFKKGVAIREYRKIYARNEALDCRVYAMAALAILRPNWGKIEKTRQQQTAAAVPDQPFKKHPVKPAIDRNQKKSPARRRRGIGLPWGS